MKKYRKQILICAGLVTLTNVAAQQQQKNDSTVNRTVVVENQYNPEVMDAFKVNVLPKIEEPAVAKTQIDYASAIHPLGSFPVTHMDAMERELSPEKARRGYVRLAYGNRNNTDLKGAYLWNITDRDVLDVMATFHGYSGNIGAGYDFDRVTDIPTLNYDGEWKHRFFRTGASLKYTHDFDKVSMYVGGDFASQVFSYMPNLFESFLQSEEKTEAPSFGHQLFMSGGGYVGVSSVKDALPVEFAFQTGYKMFNRKHGIYIPGGISESVVNTKGYISAGIDDRQDIGVTFGMDNVFYDKSFSSYSLIKLRPYYSVKTESVSFTAGVNVDFQISNDGGLKLSPDVKFDYTFADNYVLYVHVTGNTRLNDFGTINGFSPFWVQSPIYNFPLQLNTSYTPYDAKIGLKASPLTNLGFGIYAGYRETRNELFSMPYSDEGGIYNRIAQAKARVAYAGLSVDYSFRDILDFGLNGNFYSWDVQKEMEKLLWLKPLYSIGFNARAKVFKGFHAMAQYNYEGRKKTLGIKADAVNELNLGAEYLFNDRVNVFLKLNNILNKNYVTESGYPVQGFNVMAGLSLNF
ncbi:outer membrane beta-barrel protein [Bacteroides caecigallinarum]|uniref:outer membrane beta-barrel protein n=1 Tax=Bacteroides caecigallinarum TaxID=1411144 RepID=UPI001F19160C|nr:outer membrane beta-barrel protein [Bacteroides caecigallinarum]MCF2580479.1 outer membrane beta-barrel protein [Bacteroides caecigallinarum]